MLITSEFVSERLRQFQSGRITLEALVAWAEQAMDEEEIAPEATEVVARIGLADVPEFALEPSDLESLQRKLAHTGAQHTA